MLFGIRFFASHRRLALFDIDGVLANDTHRVDHALNRRWADYFAHERVSADLVWAQGRSALDAEVRAGATVAYLTGRREDLRGVTSAWLREHGFPYGALYMRPLAVRTPLANLKSDIMTQIQDVADFSAVVLYDDDPEVVRVVRERFGEDAAVHCTWHVKQKALVKKAVA